MTPSDAQDACANHLQKLLAMPKGQRWAKQVLDGTEPRYPHQRTELIPPVLKAHTRGKNTVGLLPDGHGGMCRFGAIDLDMPRDGETLLALLELLQGLQASASERRLKTFCTFSGRRGFHLVLPLAFPTPWNVVHRALRRVARDVGYEPAELFPTKGKCLKLPCGVHGATGAWSVVLPDLSEASLDILEQMAADIAQGLQQAERGEPVEPNWEAQVALLESIQPCGPQELEDAAGESTVPDLERLEDGTHPQCITALLEQGPRPETTLNGENLNLARYCAQRGLDGEEADALATAFWEKLPEGFSKKDLGASLQNFRGSFTKAQEGESTYLFRCSDMAAGGPEQARKLVAYGRCKGEACPCWPWGPGRPESSLDQPGKGAERAVALPGEDPDEDPDENPGDLHSRRLWRALQLNHAEGQQLTLSLVLAAAERLPEDEHPKLKPVEVGLADVLAEREFLAAALGPEGDEVMKAAVLLSPSGFNAYTKKQAWDAWVAAQANQRPPATATWKAHLDRLADTALRVESKHLGVELQNCALDREVGPADALANTAQGVSQLQRAATPDLAPADDHLETVVRDLLSATKPRIPVRHPGLQRVLGGGFRPGRLIAAGGPPGAGKTTVALQLADEAAAEGVPVLFLSMEMTKDQLMQASLSRLSGLNGRDLDAGLAPGSPEALKLVEALKTYKALAQRLYLVEGDERHTPGRLAALVAQVRHQQDLEADAPVLVVVDYLQLMTLGREGETYMPETLRVGALATALKLLARSTGAAVLALSDVTKEAMKEAESGGRIGPGVFRDSARVLHACDTALVVQSGTVPAQRGRPAQNLLELAMEEVGLSDARRQQLEQALMELRHPGDTYSRWTVLKNRGGQAGGEVWSIYRRHLSQYLPCIPGEANADQLRNLGGGHAF